MEKELIVSSGVEYFMKYYNLTEQDEIYEIVSDREIEDIRKIIALEVAIFVLRRTSAFCSSSIYALDLLWNQEVMKYEDVYSKEYCYYNKNINW